MPKITGFYVGNKGTNDLGAVTNVFYHPNDGIKNDYFIYNNFGSCLDDSDGGVDYFPDVTKSNGSNCFNSGTNALGFPYNGGHPCNRGCGCKNVGCSESDNFFTSGLSPSTTPISTGRQLYVPPRMNVKIHEGSSREYARDNVKADVMLNWSHNAWRGKTPCEVNDDPDCVQDGVEPPRKKSSVKDKDGNVFYKDGRCVIERKLAPDSSFPTVPIKIDPDTGDGVVIEIEKDRWGNVIVDKGTCEASARGFSDAYHLREDGHGALTIDDVTGEEIGGGPYHIRWQFHEFNELKCCGRKVITKKSPWFIPIADDSNFGITNNPNPQREQLGFCYTPTQEVVLIPNNISAQGSEGCTNFENQNDRINAKEGAYDATQLTSTKFDAGAYTVIYRGCNYYDACPQENSQKFAVSGDTRGDTVETAGRSLHLIIPQNQMLSVANLNITRTEKGPFVSSYAGWGDGSWAKFGNPAPYNYSLRTWDYGIQNPDWGGTSSEYSKNKYIPHIIPSKGDTFCEDGGHFGACRNPESNKRLDAFNIQPQPFKATEENTEKYKTLDQAVADQRAHAKCCGVGCALDIHHGLDFWFDHDFNYGAVNCGEIRAAVSHYVGNNTGHIACGDCGDNLNGGGSGPVGYATWFKGGKSCGNGYFPAALDSIIWSSVMYKKTDHPGSLEYWKKTGLMPFGNFSGFESYVDDNCYGGSLHGKIRKTTNSEPIIIYSDDHKLRPGDEVYVQGVVGNFKANNYDSGTWKAVNYEDKKGRQSATSSPESDLPIWPDELRKTCEAAPPGGWAATQLAEKYPYFTVCGLEGTDGEDYLPTQHSYALCTCAGNLIEGFIEKGTNLPDCEKDIQVVMNTCTSDITLAEEKTATSTLSGSGPPVVTQGSAVDLGCSGDTLEDRAKPGREEECEQICESYGYCGVIGVYVQKTDNNGDPIRTGSNHAECQDCLEGNLKEVYDDSRHVMSKTECDELAKHYERFVLDTPDEKHYPATKRGTYQGSLQFTPLNWATAFDPEDPTILKPQSWLGCPNTGEWNLYAPRENSTLTINEQFNVPLVYGGNSMIPVGTKLFAGGGANSGDLMSMPPHRPDLANDYYVTLDQDGFCGGCADHYMSAYGRSKGRIAFKASVTPGNTDDIGDETCGFRCDGSLWWDGNCCNCKVQGGKDFDQVVHEAIIANCGDDAVRVTGNNHRPNKNVSNKINCAYNTELGLRKKFCRPCGCASRIEDPPLINNSGQEGMSHNSNVCCDCSCTGAPMKDCGPEGENSPACNHPYPTIDLINCCKPPMIECPGNEEGHKVEHGNLECECYKIQAGAAAPGAPGGVGGVGGGGAPGPGGMEAGDGGGIALPDMTIWGYRHCKDKQSGQSLCMGFPEGRRLECWDKEITCDSVYCENSCPEPGAGYVEKNPLGQTPSCRRIGGEEMVPAYCMNSGKCENGRTGCKGLPGLDIDLNWTGSNWESDWTLMGDVGLLQCVTYEKTDSCLQARCIFPNGGIQIAGHSGRFKKLCKDAGGAYQKERYTQPIPGADCGSCVDQFGGDLAQSPVLLPGATAPTFQPENFNPAKDGHFIRLSMGCSDNVETEGTTGSLGASGAGLISGESYNTDQMSLAVQVASCGIRTCEAEVIWEHGWDSTGTYGTDFEHASSLPSVTGIGCYDFKEPHCEGSPDIKTREACEQANGSWVEAEHPCKQGCFSTMFTGPDYPCTECCSVNVGGGYAHNGHVVCSQSAAGFCYSLAKRKLGFGDSRNQELGFSGRSDLHRRPPEIFTVHYVDIDEEKSRGYDLLHVERHSYTGCAWETEVDEETGIVSGPNVFIGLADKQEAQAGNFNSPDYRRSFYRNALSMHKDWPPPTHIKERIPSNLEVNSGATYLTIAVDSASALTTKAGSLNRHLEQRIPYWDNRDANTLVSESSPIDFDSDTGALTGFSRKAGTSSLKSYESDAAPTLTDKFIGLELPYNNVNPHPFGRKPWPVAVQSTPNTPIKTTHQSNLTNTLESYRRSPSSPVYGRVGLKPTAQYLNSLEQRGLDDPDFDPYMDIEIKKVEDVYENNMFKHTVVTTFRPHDIQTGEKIVISDSIAFLATCKNIPNAYCRNGSDEDDIRWDLTTEMECQTAEPDGFEWYTDFLDEEITKRDCSEKVNKKTGEKGGDWVPGTRKSSEGIGGDIENKDPNAPKRADVQQWKSLPPPHCQIEAHVEFKTGCRDYQGNFQSGTTNPFCCDSCIDTQEGSVEDGTSEDRIRVCPRTPWDGEHVVRRLSSTTFALYSERHVNYEDFESSVRVNDATNTLNTSNTARKVSQDDTGEIIDNRVYTNWQANFDNSVNFVCEEAYTDIDTDQAQKGMCDADPRCIVAFKDEKVSCFSKGICKSLDSIDDSTLELKLHKRAACNASDHCFAYTTKNAAGEVTDVECIGVENPNTTNSSTDPDKLATHMPGYNHGADVGLGKPSGWKANGKGGLTMGAIYVAEIDVEKIEYMEKVLEENQHDMRSKWTRKGGMFEIGVGNIRQIDNFHQDFIAAADQSSAPFNSNFRVLLADRCCNHKYPPMVTSCAGLGNCDPGFTSWVGQSNPNRPIEEEEDGASAAVINITITKNV